MSVKTGFTSGLVFLFFVLTLPAAAQVPSAAQCIPQDALICLHLSQPKALLELLAGPEMTEAITSLPLYQQQSSSPQFKEFVNTIRFLETSLGTDWRTGLAQLTGGGITVAICPDDVVVAIVDAEDQSLLERLHEIFVNIARAEAARQGQDDRIASKDYNGVNAWTFDGNEAHAIVGRRLIFANRSEVLKTVLDLNAGKGGATLAASPAHKAAQQTARTDAVATAFVNLKPFTNLPPIAEVLEKSRQNPLAALFFAGIAESFRSSNWLNVGLLVEDKTLTLDAVTDGKVAGQASPAAFALPQKADDGAWPNLSVPRRIAALSLFRDLHDFYAAKDELFPERTSGLIFFENMMGIFFTGRDLTSEVLAETEPEVRLVVAEQQYDPEVGTPQVRLPAFALILRLRDPEQFSRVAEEAWQKAVGLINFTRGQQALPGLIIDRPAHAQTKFTMAYFSTADVEDKTKLETRFNVRPALAMPGDYLVLSSTDSLACDLIDALGRNDDAQETALAQTHSLLEVNGTQLASMLSANRESLIRQDMVKKGKTQTEAAAGIDMLITLVGCVDGAKLDIGTRDGLTAVKLQAQLNLPRP